MVMVVRSGRQEQVAAEQKEETRAPAERTSEPKSTDFHFRIPRRVTGYVKENPVSGCAVFSL